MMLLVAQIRVESFGRES